MAQTLRKITSHVFALLLGGILAFTTLRVAASNADPVPEAMTSPAASTETLLAQDARPTTQRNFVSAAIQRTGPAVVRIDIARTVENQLPPMMQDPFFRDFFGDQFFQQMPQERRVEGQGSGFIIDRAGMILTNAHVVSGAEEVTVTLQDGRQFDASVLGTDTVTDLAVVKISDRAADLPVAPLGNSDALQVGDWAIAVGSPGGLNNTVTLGIISTLDRPSSQVGIPDKRLNFLQTDAAINPGNSGGPLLNDRGEVIGINTAIRANAMGIGFAIPINKAKELKDILAAGQEVPHPYVGIEMRDITADQARRSNADPNSSFTIPEVDGVFIWRILPDTPAAEAGLRRGDVITEIDGKRVTSGTDIQNIVEQSGVNGRLRFTIRRGNQTLNINVRTAQLQNQR
ncbi:HhoA/HhoB/HtrA family serine endopeptidase [Spirulina sp. CCNP1310]|uniref:HhoA/HhoB/HtrA family serine endopeptidase n=1 Tax=Spirulina sp. CCNP1310 TaxID=3110249 RepID=UPI002B2044E5|nr:HhoA/HhoB/HtrA family serine endopeptidase [Spirulina sp. CCNP1310]MEA5421419.1 HhoA/HhoB/HtrA family serine endopeptidase [Spirulina sp. CCNP1310]